MNFKRIKIYFVSILIMPYLVFSLSSWGQEDCLHPSAELDHINQQEKLTADVVHELERMKCQEILDANKDRMERSELIVRDGDKGQERPLTFSIHDYLAKKSTLLGGSIRPDSLPKMLAFGEDHQAEQGNRKRGQLMTLILLESCLEGRPLTFLSEALTPAKIALFQTSLIQKKDYLKNALFLAPSIIDELPDTFLHKVRLDTWEEVSASAAKEEMKVMAESITHYVDDLLQKSQSQLSDHEREKLIDGYRAAMVNLSDLEYRLSTFVQRHAKSRDMALVKKTSWEMDNNQDQILLVIAGENHLTQNRHLPQLLAKEGAAVSLLHSRSEQGMRSPQRKDLWALIGKIEDNLDLIKASIRSFKQGRDLYLPSFPMSLSAKSRL